MNNNVATTNIKLPSKLKKKLAQAAHSVGKEQSWIVIQALQDYLEKLDRHCLVEEARRQSLLASRHATNDETDLADFIIPA